MADQSSFPTSIDATPTDKVMGDPVPVADWNKYLDAVVNLETKVGIDSSAATGSIDYKIVNRQCGKVVQIVVASTTSTASNGSSIPGDNTIPQIGEGAQLLSASITPTNSANTLLIRCNFWGADNSARDVFTLALFQDSTNNALNSVGQNAPPNGSDMFEQIIEHWVVAGTISPTTFQVRYGGHAGTTYALYDGGTNYYGANKSLHLVITEYASGI
jgi:hypothetical protein